MNKSDKYLPIIVIFSVILCGLSVLYSSSAQDPAEVPEIDEEKVEDLQEKIEKYEKKLEELNSRSQSLANEIETMDSQISLTQLRIQSSISKIAKTEEEISKLTTDIEDLGLRIEKLINSMDRQKQLLNNRLRERYKSQESTPLFVIFGSSTLDVLIQKTEYLRIMEIQDNRLIDDMKNTKDRYDLQKKLYEDKKQEEEDLRNRLVVEKANLDAYKSSLDAQKIEKEKLLEVTQNDEEKYQELLEDAQKELNQIRRAVSVLMTQESEKVEKGDIIGVQGNTGYSFGDHLHFGVYKYSSFDDIDGWDWYYSNYIDPAKKLESKTVYWNTGCESPGSRTIGSGDWDWPMKNPTISQGYGKTCWSNIYYGGKPHPAYDMHGPYGSLIYAVDDGDAFFCRNCLGDGGNGVFIFHDDDYMTLYWHLQ